MKDKIKISDIINGLTWLGILADVIAVNIYLFNNLGSGIKDPKIFKNCFLIFTIYIVIMLLIKFTYYFIGKKD